MGLDKTILCENKRLDTFGYLRTNKTTRGKRDEVAYAKKMEFDVVRFLKTFNPVVTTMIARGFKDLSYTWKKTLALKSSFLMKLAVGLGICYAGHYL